MSSYAFKKNSTMGMHYEHDNESMYCIYLCVCVRACVREDKT